MSRARFVAAARLEYFSEVVYYNKIEPGLGHRFAEEVEEAAARALAFPRSGSPSRFSTRRAMLKTFPFSLVYRVEPDGILVFALAHYAQRPHYWQSRTRAR